MPRAPLPSELERFVAKPRPAVVATITKDGSPISTATWYEWVDGRVLLTMDASGHRIQNLRRDPRVALTVLGESWYNHVSLLGRVVEIGDDPEFAAIDRLSRRYEGRPYPERDWQCVYVLFEVERWHTYGDPAAEVA
jgi:PPOX class probable F420-dependent enzyme